MFFVADFWSFWRFGGQDFGGFGGLDFWYFLGFLENWMIGEMSEMASADTNVFFYKGKIRKYQNGVRASLVTFHPLPPPGYLLASR